MIDINYSGWVITEELLKFYRSLGFNINDAVKALILKRHGAKINFYTFLSIFDFKKDTCIKFI